MQLEEDQNKALLSARPKRRAPCPGPRVIPVAPVVIHNKMNSFVMLPESSGHQILGRARQRDKIF